MAGIHRIFELQDEYNSEISLSTLLDLIKRTRLINFFKINYLII